MKQPITVSLETAERMREAGWDQDIGIYEWRTTKQSKNPFLHCRSGRDIGQGTAAPTAEEILRVLPKSVNFPIKGGRKRKQDHVLVFGYRNWRSEKDDAYCGYTHYTAHTLYKLHDYYPTLAEAAAEAFIFLREQNLLPV